MTRIKVVSAGAFLAVLTLIASGCGDDIIGSTSAGFQTQTKELDFGRVLEGAEVTRQVELTATGRADVVVDVSTTGPFRAPSTIDIPGGGSASLDVTFTAPDGDADGKLVLSVRDERFEIALSGRGVRPLDCIPTAPCRVSRFVLETESCQEVTADNGTMCTPEGLCLENGVCLDGVCVGTPRTCDDGNACTQDACSPDVGCVQVDVSKQCPTPANPCEFAICSPATGCGTAVREDQAICGSVDCITANLCVSGVCKPLPTPEGFLCAPPTPCQGEGTCSQGECRRPDAGPMAPAWSMTLGPAPADVPRREAGILAFNGNLYFETCGLASQDGGCALVSFTPNGFQRFEEPLGFDGGVLHAVTSTGAVLQQEDLLALHALAGGARIATVPLESFRTVEVPDAAVPRVSEDGLAVDQDGGVVVAVSWIETFAAISDAGMDGGEDGGEDAGVLFIESSAGLSLAHWSVDPDAGVSATARFLVDAGPVGNAVSVALSGDGATWLHDAMRVWRFAVEPDGGVPTELEVQLPIAGGQSLSVGASGLWAFTGGELAINADGGVVPLLLPTDAGVGEASIDFEVLSTAGTGFTFFRACRDPLPEPCTEEERAVVVRAFALSDLLPLWETPVLPGLTDGRIIEASTLGGVLTGTVATLTEAQLNGTWRTDVQLFLAGERAMLCQLSGEPRVGSAVFNNGFLYVLAARNGQWRIEAYDLKGMPFIDSGWSKRGAASGQRRER